MIHPVETPLEGANRYSNYAHYEGMGYYFVGLSTNLQYPGIISGPFKTKPLYLAPHHLYQFKNGKWILVNW